MASGLPVDRLPDVGPSLEVVLVDDARFGDAADQGPRAPHRHDYHELIWTREGSGEHLIDGVRSVVRPRSVTVIGRGQVHVFQRATGLSGAVVRFGEELLAGEPLAGASPRWLIGRRAAQSVLVPESDVPRLEAVIAAMAAEIRRPPDPCTADLERHLLSTLLLWIERWYDASRAEPLEASDPELQLYRRFAPLLEQDFASHHDTPHYADALRVPQSALSRALTHVTGRSTKQLIMDRRMLEAARLLRFSDLSVGEIAFRAGFPDPLYFSRAFKGHFGESPTAYRDRVHGRNGGVRGGVSGRGVSRRG